MPLVKSLCGTRIVTTVVWIHILAEELRRHIYESND